MPNILDAKVLQRPRASGSEDRLVDFVLAERRLIPFEAQAPQPTPDIHDGVLILAREQ